MGGRQALNRCYPRITGMLVALGPGKQREKTLLQVKGTILLIIFGLRADGPAGFAGGRLFFLPRVPNAGVKGCL